MALLQALQLLTANAQPKQPEPPQQQLLPALAELLGSMAVEQRPAPPAPIADNAAAINALLLYCSQLGAC